MHREYAQLNGFKCMVVDSTSDLDYRTEDDIFGEISYGDGFSGFTNGNGCGSDNLTGDGFLVYVDLTFPFFGWKKIKSFGFINA